jgi:CTP synthase
MGGTMRLGAYPCLIKDNTLAFKIYQSFEISERHRHRYELNNLYREVLVEKGMVLSGLSPDNKLVEIMELSGKRWFLGCQFHPEFKSRPRSPHPLFRDFIRAAIEARKDRRRDEQRPKRSMIKKVERSAKVDKLKGDLPLWGR